MGTLNYIAYVIFAVLFISIAIAVYVQYQQGAAEQDFRLKAEGLAGEIEQLGNMSAGSVQNFEISVPQNCELRFTDNTVVIVIGSWSDNFPVGIPVSGPTFSDQKLSLRLERTGNGVNVSAA
jgi:hypothetical protein